MHTWANLCVCVSGTVQGPLASSHEVGRSGLCEVRHATRHATPITEFTRHDRSCFAGCFGGVKVRGCAVEDGFGGIVEQH